MEHLLKSQQAQTHFIFLFLFQWTDFTFPLPIAQITTIINPENVLWVHRQAVRDSFGGESLPSSREMSLRPVAHHSLQGVSGRWLSHLRQIVINQSPSSPSSERLLSFWSSICVFISTRDQKEGHVGNRDGCRSWHEIIPNRWRTNLFQVPGDNDGARQFSWERAKT